MIVFDGTHPYEALIGALRPDSVAVWCRRPLWKRGCEPGAARPRGRVRRRARAGRARRVRGRGPTVALRDRAHRVDPIVLLDRDELLPRAEAEAELGLEPGATNVLVSLGQGAEVREATARCLSALAGRDDVQVAALSSAIAAAGERPRRRRRAARHLPDEPLLRRLRRRGRRRRLQRLPRADRARRAVAVRADAPRHRRPGGPRPVRRVDGDRARGRGPGRPGARGEARAAARARRPVASSRRGSPSSTRPAAPAEAARWLAGLAGAGPRATPPDARARGPVPIRAPASGARSRAFRRRWGTFFASLPRTAVRLTRQQLTQPRARALMLALGIPEGDVAAAVRPRSPTPARRRSGPWWSPTRSPRSASCARSGSGSSTCRAAARARPSSPAAPTRSSLAGGSS